MAKIKPFKAWRYNDEYKFNIADLTSPLYNVVSFRNRERLYKNPLNSIHLSVPREGYHSKRYVERIEEWKQVGILKLDQHPCIYVYYQYYSLNGESKIFCRKGFISLVQLHEWNEKVILRHEDTIPKAVQGRKQVLAQTGLNVSPTHGLYTEENLEIEHILDLAIENPVYDSEDYQGVRDVLGVVKDPNEIKKILAMMSDKKIILADGHHRYQGALMHREEMKAKNREHNGTEPYNYHMMYLTNTESADLKVFPTHRLISGLQDFDEYEFLSRLNKYFYVKEIEDEADVFQLVAGRKWAFGMFVGDRTFNIRLRQEKQFNMDWDLPEVVKNLDLSVLHYFLFEKVLGVLKNAQSSSENISYEPNINVCLKKILKNEAQIAVLTQGISMDTVKSVCFSGHLLPQKSTFFYPKVICGYLFGSIRDEDNE